jgi:hypothetical protein
MIWWFMLLGTASFISILTIVILHLIEEYRTNAK